MPPNLDFSPHNSLSTLVRHSSIELLLDDFARWRFPPYILEKVPCNPLHVQCGPNAQSTPCPMWAQRAIHPIIRRVFHAPTICPGIQLDLALPSRPTPRRFWLSGLARPSRTPPGLRLTQGTPILCPEPIVSGYTKHALFTLRQLHCSILSHLSH